VDGGVRLEDKVLQSERLFLKPLSFSELSFIHRNETDKVETLIEQEAIFDFVKLAISKKLEKMKNIDEKVHDWYTYWLIIDKDSNKGIGFIGFKGVPDESGYSEVGYSISSNYRRKGLMSEALSLLINWASTFGNCKGITAKRVLKANVGSNNVLNNCNFKLYSSSSEENNYILKFR
jgi:RimJ/RimL family protein N-acetyltransferase